MINSNVKNGKSIIGDLLLFILAFAIPAEPFVPDIVKYVCIGFLFALVIVKYGKIYLSSFMMWVVVFLLYMCISLCYTPTGSQGLSTIIMMFGSVLHSFSIIMYLHFRYDDFEEGFIKVMNGFTAGTVAIVLFTIFVERANLLSGYWRLGKVVFENYGTFMILSYSIIICLMWSLYALFEKHFKAYIPIMILMILAAALSGTKKTVVAIIMAMPIYFFFKYRKKAFKLVLIMLLVLLAIYLMYIIVMNVDILYRTIGNRIEIYIRTIMGETGGSASIVERRDMRNCAIKWFTENPVFGKGVSAFRALYSMKTGKYLYSHCNYTEILCNHGMVGFILYYGFLLFLLFKSIFEYIKTNSTIHLFSIVFLFVVMILDYGQVSYYRVHYLLIYQLIAATVSRTEKNTEVSVVKSEVNVTNVLGDNGAQQLT